jgi:MFS family permease
LLRQRDVGPYIVGAAISASGTWFQNLAAAILVYRLTGSAFALGLVGFAQFAPVLALAPWAGTLADRFDRRRLVVVLQLCNTGVAALLAALAWLGLVTTAVVISLVLALGFIAALSSPAAEALVVSLVPAHDVPSAVALKSMTYNIARLAGPAAAGLTIAALGVAPAFAINALSYLALALGAFVVRPRLQARARLGSGRFRDGLDLLRRDPSLVWLLVIVATVGFAADPVNTLAPAFARSFGRPDTQAALIIAAFGGGAVTAAVAVSGRVLASPRRTAAMLAMLALGLALFSWSHWLPAALVFLFVSGFGYLASNTAATSRLQLSVEDAYRGRIMALWTIAFLGLRPLASLADGAIASTAGVRNAGIALSLPALVAAAFTARRAMTPGDTKRV